MINNNIPKAFTVEYTGLVSALVTNCGICEAYNPDFQPKGKHPDVKHCNAIWDTGAMGSVISVNIAQELNLQPTGKAKVFHANGEAIVNTYFVNILLPNKVGFSSLRVTEGNLNGADVLIGMDIISRGDFVTTSSQGKTMFSFQIPSTHCTDYVKEYNQKIHIPVNKDQKIGRNNACPCGSGKKYKQCCGK